MANNNKLNFYVGDESKLNIAKLYEEELQENTLFSDMFKHVMGEINLVLPGICTDVLHLPDEKDVFPLVEKVSNNIFGFIGDRGSGKSSSMMSVAVSLNNSYEFKRAMPNLFPHIEKRTFHVMETIDPSFFDKKVNILDIVIGKMYLKFKKDIENEQSKYSLENEQSKYSLRNDLLDCFQMVRRCIANNLGITDMSEDDDIESLEYLSNGVELQHAMQQLINKYLIYYRSDVLVIPIDDMDMHTECGYMMLEQVRKYLIQHNVIILMALKLDQMERVIQLEIANQYKSLKDWGLTKPENLIERASRYMAKLLPHSHRFFMPTYDDIVDSQLELWIQTQDGLKKHNGKNWSLDKNFPNGTAKYVVTKSIFEKTRYLFYHAKGKVSPIVPENLRELRHLVGLLYDMPHYEKGGATEYNKELFKEYFFTSWMTLNLDESGKKIVESIFKISDASTINKSVIQSLINRFSRYFENNDKKERGHEEIKNIIDVQNTSYNISIGDVMAILIHLKNRIVGKMDLNLLFAIETFYSMKLYEYYDYRTEPRFVLADRLSEDNLDNSIRQNSLLDGISKYHQLIGGDCINPKYFRLMTPEGNPEYEEEDKWRAIRRISIKQIDRMLSTIEERSKTDTTDKLENLHSAELLALFISRKKYNTRSPKIYDSSYRKNLDVVYCNNMYTGEDMIDVRSYHPNQTLYFDAASFFTNITDIRMSYDKLNKKIYPLANRFKDSLLNKLRLITIQAYKIDGVTLDNPRLSTSTNLFESDDKLFIQLDGSGLDAGKYYDVNVIDRWFLSWCSIRNAEVLEALTLHLAEHGMGSEVDLFEYLKSATDFSIKTYDKNNDNKDAYKIQFDYIKQLSTVFSKAYIQKFESFIILRNKDIDDDVSETMEELCSELLRNGKAKEFIEQSIKKSKSPLLNMVNREKLVEKLEEFRIKSNIRSWGKKTFYKYFPQIYNEIKRDDSSTK